MSTTASKSKRTRTGCLCCRKRHKKCDEQKPSCNFCVSKGLTCEWPIRGQIFVNYGSSESNNESAFDNRSLNGLITPESSPKALDHASVFNKTENDYGTTSYLMNPILRNNCEPITLPSLKNYHFIPNYNRINLDKFQISFTGDISTPKIENTNFTAGLRGTKRLSVDSLLN